MRPIDENKILRIKRETKVVIVEKGYHGASIAEIARRADVSDGYLYRHYKGKPDLVKDILEAQLKEFHDYVFDLLKTVDMVKELTRGVIAFLFNLSKEEPEAIAFSHILVYDHEFEYPLSRKLAINKFVKEILEMGIKTGEFANTRREIDVLTTIFTIPVKTIEYRSRGYDDNLIDEDQEIELLVEMCMNALQ